MKIQEIIRQRRLAKNFTQEQVADYLGVTAPAVNKWEKGVSYPDITLLPALARLLDTDLNTLLCFQNDLTEQEIALFLNQVSETIHHHGFSSGYSLAMSKVKEYPTCASLICHLAMLLDGALGIHTPENAEEYRLGIDSLYQRAAQSSNPAIREQACSALFHRQIQKQDYDSAQKLLDSMTDPSPVDKKQLQANLFIAQGNLTQAAKLTEERLLSSANEIHGTLLTLMELAIQENRLDDAACLADADRQCAQTLDLWEFNTYVAQVQFYASCKKRKECIKLLIPMLKSLTKKWEPQKSPLYRHIAAKEPAPDFGPMMQKALLQSICQDKDFLKDCPELKRFQKTWTCDPVSEQKKKSPSAPRKT